MVASTHTRRSCSLEVWTRGWESRIAPHVRRRSRTVNMSASRSEVINRQPSFKHRRANFNLDCRMFLVVLCHILLTVRLKTVGYPPVCRRGGEVRAYCRGSCQRLEHRRSAQVWDLDPHDRSKSASVHTVDGYPTSVYTGGLGTKESGKAEKLQ